MVWFGMINLLSQISVNRKQLVPTLVHDENIKIIICTLGLIVGLILCYKIMKDANG